MYKPNLYEVEKMVKSGEYKTIPISREIFSDFTTPIEVLKILKNVSKHCFLFESAEDNKRWGRYTFLGFNPKMCITCLDGKIKIKNGENICNELSYETETPDIFIQNILNENKSPKPDYLPPFTGGLVGYFSYDYIKYTEKTLRLDAHDEENLNDVDLMLFDKVIAFDNLSGKIIVIANMKTKDYTAEYEKAKLAINDIIRLIKTGRPCEYEVGKLKSEIRTLFEKERFVEMIRKAKQYIKDGDIFQAVLSNRFDAEYEGSLLDVYRVLRTLNPSPYMFYMGGDDVEIAGASPETLVKLENEMLYTYPLAGTRPRGETAVQDLALEKELLADEKELAEHNMLVDLGRNDLGKISKFGTVELEKYLSVVKYSHVMHIASTLRGEVLDGKNCIDAINAVLPAGTLSGAPKIRAMQIINELENNKRGIYGGAIGYLDFSGNMDACIAIRFAFKKNGRVFIRAGAGVVHDSVPEKEYEECLNKAGAIIAALKQADGGIE